MLTQEQKSTMSEAVGLNLSAVGFYASKKQLFDFGNLAYAAGEAIERERAEAVDRVMEHVARQTRPY